VVQALLYGRIIGETLAERSCSTRSGDGLAL
jgi:hypothetical protein